MYSTNLANNTKLFGSFSASKALDVKFVDYQTKLNRKNHHSNEFEKAGNIIRRGQEFVLNVDFDREIKPDHDVIILQFTYGIFFFQSKVLCQFFFQRGYS